MLSYVDWHFMEPSLKILGFTREDIIYLPIRNISLVISGWRERGSNWLPASAFAFKEQTALRVVKCVNENERPLDRPTDVVPNSVLILLFFFSRLREAQVDCMSISSCFIHDIWPQPVSCWTENMNRMWCSHNKDLVLKALLLPVQQNCPLHLRVPN